MVYRGVIVRKVKTVRVNSETHRALVLIKYVHGFNSLDKVIRFLIKYYRENEVKKNEGN